MIQSDQVFRSVRAKILSGQFKPGAKLKFSALASSCKVSLGAVREALSKLSADGFVVPEAQKGYTVSPVSTLELIDLTNARIAIERICLEASVVSGDLDWESALVASFHRLSRLAEAEADDSMRINEAWAEAHSDFHYRLVAACGSPWLLRIRELLYAQTERYRRLSLTLDQVNNGRRDVNAEHRSILDAALARDAPLACDLMTSHLRETMKILLASRLFGNEGQAPGRAKDKLKDKFKEKLKVASES